MKFVWNLAKNSMTIEFRLVPIGWTLCLHFFVWSFLLLQTSTSPGLNKRSHVTLTITRDTIKMRSLP